MAIKNIICAVIAVCAYSFSYSQKISVNQMNVSWEFQQDSIVFEADAPDDGWIALGFNSKNDIVGSNLIMVNVINGKASAEDFFVVSAGNPRPVEEFDVKPQVSKVSGTESNGQTKVRFSLPVKASDTYHFNLQKGHEIWLICAYSMEDEFDHHSRMRKHVKIEL